MAKGFIPQSHRPQLVDAVARSGAAMLPIWDLAD
jgi:hypothetical protein